jgi:tRNA(adenine34) deaminase
MHEYFMKMALQEAEAAMEQGEVPVGAVIVEAVFDGKFLPLNISADESSPDATLFPANARVIARAHNQREALRDPTAHAEMIAITQAAEAKGSWRLDGCTLFVTLEPCPMCAGAILQARIPAVVYGAADPKAGAVDSLYRLLNDDRLNHRTLATGGVMAEPCGQILSEFFRRQRLLGKK